MPRIVMKFGGTSVADLSRIRNVAALIRSHVDRGYEVAVTVSAMAGTTNQLIGWCKDLDPLCNPREYDAVLATGEQVSVGLLAIALQNLQVDARSWLGWQVPLRTDASHAKARIESIAGKALIACMSQGQVPVLAGFQGVGPDGSITTLGRGGTDTSAVALAIAVQADQCNIYTDVDGVYTADPHIVPNARRLGKISYEEMLELASVGAKVLQTRSVELAMKQRVRVAVLSSFDRADDQTGTLVLPEEEIMEKNVVAGVALASDEARVIVKGVPDCPGIAAAVFGTLADAGVNVDMIVQNVSDELTTDVTFTVAAADLSRAMALLAELRGDIGYARLIADKDVAKISVVGVGMRSHAGVAATMFRTLAERGINIEVISTSEIKISVLIKQDYMELAMRVLHAAFGLDDAEPAGHTEVCRTGPPSAVDA